MFERYGSEQGRYYTRDGAPAYTVKARSGDERKSNLTDCRKNFWVPSVTHVLSMLPKPGLEKWKMEQLLASALTLPRKDEETLEEFAERARQDSREQVKKAGRRGKRLHKAIQQALSGELYESAFDPHIRALKAKFEEMGLDFYAGETERTFAHADGFGGTCDWHQASIVAVADFKNKPTIDLTSKKKWGFDEHVVQLAAYAYGLDLWPQPRLINFFVGVEDEVILPVEWTQKNVEFGLRLFQALLNVWCVSRGYDPRFQLIIEP